MHSQYGEKVQFFYVYSREAHAADSERPNRSEVEQPITTEERREVAAKFFNDMDTSIPALLDNIDDKASNDYASLPDRLFLVGKDGKMAYSGARGPRGFTPEELQQAIEKELAEKPAEVAPATHNE